MPQTLINQGASYNQANWKLRDVYNIAGGATIVLPALGAPKLTPPRRARQDELIRRHDLFGGRSVELENLDLLLRDSPNSFHLLHAPSGFGKTALLVNWILRLQTRRQPVCYHFVNRLEGMADEDFALRNLCEQLAVCHGMVEALSASVEDLRVAYVELIRLPPPEEKSLIIVIDGLDEAKGWSPGSVLLPASLPRGVHLFFSARIDNDMSRDEFLARLGVPLDRVDSIHLGQLLPDAIAQLLAAAGGHAPAYAGNETFVKAMFDVSNGDPFYLHFLVEDVVSGKLTPEALFEQLHKLNRPDEPDEPDKPDKLTVYLDRWKTQLFEDVDLNREEVYALLGLLTAALGPIKAGELSGASTLLRKGALLDRELSGSLGRYLSGNRKNGYALCHPRFQKFLSGNIFNKGELIDYRLQLLNYCRKWREHFSDYALDQLVAHLKKEKHYDELYALVDRDWKSARMRQTGSPRAFTTDVDVAIATAITGSEPNICEAIRCCLIYATIASSVATIPVELLGVLARLDHAKAARHYALLIRDPQRRSEGYATIGRALAFAGKQDEAVEALSLAFASSEHIAEANARAKALLSVAETLQALQVDTLRARILAMLEATAMDLTDASMLEAVARYFDRAGEAQKASELADRANAARQSEAPNFSLGFSGMDLSGLFATSGAEADLHATISKLCSNADVLLKEGRRFDALRNLVQARDQLSALATKDAARKYTGESWLQLATAFAQAGDMGEAQKSALMALGEARSAVSESYLLSNAKAQRMIRVATSLLGLECIDTAETAAREALACSTPSELGNGVSDFAKLADRFCDLNQVGAAQRLAQQIIQMTENVGAQALPASFTASLALAAARQNGVGDAQSLADRALAESESAGDSLYRARIIGTVALARGLIDPGTTFEVERRLIGGLSGDNKGMGLAYLAGAYARTARINEAFACVSELVQLLGPIENTIKAEVVLEAARSMIACGQNDWAVDNAKVASQSASGTPKLLADVALVLAQARATEPALQLANDVFKGAIRYHVTEDLVAISALHCSLGEQSRAREMVAIACCAIETMEREPWAFSEPFAYVALAAAKIGDQQTLDRLCKEANQLAQKDTRLRCSSAMAIALAVNGRKQDAAHFATHALDLALSFERKDTVCSSVPRLAEGLARVNDRVGLSRLRAWILSNSKYRHRELLQALLPAFAVLSDRAAIEDTITGPLELGASPGEQAYNRAMLCASAAGALFEIGERDAGERAAREALSAFGDVRDGAVTPNVLPLLVPALVAARDANGLMGLLKMPFARWPYEREWGPGVRLLVPALARLGIDDPSPWAKEALSRREPRCSEAQSDIAEAQARRGEFDKANLTAGEIKLARYRAIAFFKVAQARAERGDKHETERALEKAMLNFPAILNNPILLGRMAVLATEIGVAPRLGEGLKRAFLSAARVDFVVIDPEIFAAAVRPLCAIRDENGMSRASAIVNATGDTLARARCGASLALALAEAGEFHEAIERARHATRVIEALPDVVQKAAPLADLARALDLSGQHKEAVAAFLQALNAARHAGRHAVFDVVQKGAGIASGITPCQIGESMCRASLLWPATA